MKTLKNLFLVLAGSYSSLVLLSLNLQVIMRAWQVNSIGGWGLMIWFGFLQAVAYTALSHAFYEN
jgi:hypothetical protein